MGNICRSPLAHGLFEHMVKAEGLAEHVHVDSAGTHAYHVGEAPDPRSQDTARKRGVDLSGQRARRVEKSDFAHYDYVLAMDRENLRLLREICPAEHQHKVSLFMKFAEGRGEREVPDPYYGGPQGFERVYEMVEEAAVGLMQEVRRRL